MTSHWRIYQRNNVIRYLRCRDHSGCIRAAVPSLSGTRDWFLVEESFSAYNGGWGCFPDDSSAYIHCALHFYYYISSSLRSSGITSQKVSPDLGMYLRKRQVTESWYWSPDERRYSGVPELTVEMERVSFKGYRGNTVDCSWPLIWAVEWKVIPFNETQKSRGRWGLVGREIMSTWEGVKGSMQAC